MFFRIPDRELHDIKKSISDIHDLLRETREQYISEIGAIRASQEISAENQRNIQLLKEDVSSLRNTVRDNTNWIKEQNAIKKNRDEILRQNFYSLLFKIILSLSVLLSGFAIAGMLYRLNQYIMEQQEQIEVLKDKVI